MSVWSYRFGQLLLLVLVIFGLTPVCHATPHVVANFHSIYFKGTWSNEAQSQILEFLNRAIQNHPPEKFPLNFSGQSQLTRQGTTRDMRSEIEFELKQILKMTNFVFEMKGNTESFRLYPAQYFDSASVRSNGFAAEELFMMTFPEGTAVERVLETLEGLLPTAYPPNWSASDRSRAAAWLERLEKSRCDSFLSFVGLVFR